MADEKPKVGEAPAVPANVPASEAGGLVVPDPEHAAQVQSELAESGDALVARTSTGPVFAPRDLQPPVEPGHKGPEQYDPNAARRAAEGRGPGLQDSEVANPAHWNQADEAGDPPHVLEARAAATRAEVAGLERTADGAKSDRLSAAKDAQKRAEAQVKAAS